MATKTTSQSNLKKYFFSSVGHLAHTREVLQKSANEISKHGKLNETEGRRIIDGAIAKLKSGYYEIVHKFSTYSNSEVSALQKKVTKLEKQLTSKEKDGTPITRVSRRNLNAKKGAERTRVMA